jgi:aspartate/methionine/tyrosine aminotransferase
MQIGGSPIREMMRRLDRGEDVLSLAGGEAAFEPPADLVALVARAMAEGRNRYTSTEGLPSLRRAIAELLRDSWQIRVDPDSEVLITVGCIEAIVLAATTIVRPGDRVLLPDPGWGVVEAVVARLGAQVDHYPLVEAEKWEIDADAIIGRLGEATRLVVVNTPSNPTGAMLSREGFAELVEAAARVGGTVLSDEVYENYVYQGAHVSSLSVGSLDNVVLANSFSKTFAITGWRLGYAVSNPSLIRRMVAVKETLSLCSPSAPQWAVGQFLADSEAYRDWARELCLDTMRRVLERLRAIPGVRCQEPSGGFYLFPDLSALEPSSDLMAARLLDGGVGVIPGAFFGSGGEGRVRIGFADRYEPISRALHRLEKVLSDSGGTS